MAKDDTKRDFYPEDAQEQNFEEARRLAQENHDKEHNAPAVGVTNADEGKDVKREIKAQPENISSKNPAQVKTNE